MFKTLFGFYDYLLNKKSEVANLERKDAILAKTVMDIHRRRSNSEFVTLSLAQLMPIHKIDREGAIEATKARVQTLQKHKQTLADQRVFSREVLAQYLPSVSWIKVIDHPDGTYVAYEGNGRLAALQQVFSKADDIMVEVELYSFERGEKKILRRVDRVRRYNNLLPAD